MQFVAGEYVRLGWAMQLHFGCKRDNNMEIFFLQKVNFTFSPSDVEGKVLTINFNMVENDGVFPTWAIASSRYLSSNPITHNFE